MKPKAPPLRFHKNTPGAFYTTGECLACGVPEEIAGTCLAPLTDDNSDTYFLQQPVTTEEIEQVCRAAESCCVNAIRYAGTDTKILERLGNDPDYCDNPTPKNLIARLWKKLGSTLTS